MSSNAFADADQQRSPIIRSWNADPALRAQRTRVVPRRLWEIGGTCRERPLGFLNSPREILETLLTTEVGSDIRVGVARLAAGSCNQVTNNHRQS